MLKQLERHRKPLRQVLGLLQVVTGQPGRQREHGEDASLADHAASGLLAPPVQSRPVAGIAGSFLPKPILTGREIQVLTCWIHCDSKPEVAKSLFLSLGTVNTHLTRIRAKYAAVGRPASTKASLVARALQDGMIDIAEL